VHAFLSPERFLRSIVFVVLSQIPL
jgi:hypothetical protein